MPWEYNQATGTLSRNGIVVATNGYSGFGIGRNNPMMEDRINVGPIPRGRYTIGRPRISRRTGPHVLNLTPFGHNALGRTDFQIHGDSRTDPGNASNGCIVLPRMIREQISQSPDNIINVVR